MKGEDEVFLCKSLNAVKNNGVSSKGSGVCVVFFMFSVFCSLNYQLLASQLKLFLCNLLLFFCFVCLFIS